MDGFGGDDNILIIGATNRADSLDKALTRAGRFDLKINISLPYFHSRVKLLEYFLQNVKYVRDLDLESIGKMTVGFSPADLKNLVNQAVINSIKRQSFIAEFNDF